MDLGVKRVDFAESLGVSYDRLLAYITGKTEPSPEFFRKLIEVYPEIDLHWLISGDLIAKKVDIQIPILASIQAGSLSTPIADEAVRGYWTPRYDQENLFALEVKGNSMYPEIQEGDIAICSSSEPFLNGQIHAIGDKGYSYTLKRLFRRKDGYDLVPSNPDYTTVFVPDSDVEQIVRVVEIVRALN